MKRISKLIAALVIAVTPFVFSSAASAAPTCQIGFTGPDSNNTCTSTTTYACTVTNNNNVTIVNSNGQTAASGTVTNSGNTQGGNGTSGTVSNSNGSTFNVTITNGNNGGTGTCVATETVPATEPPVTPVAPTSNGGGAAAAKALPRTSGDSSGQVVLTVLSVLGAGALATTLGALAYRRHKA